MPDCPVTLNEFAIVQMEAAHRVLKQAVDGLTAEQIYQQPSTDTNSIGWLAWHLSRWKDRFGSIVHGEEHVWVSQGWAEKMGIEPERTGLGDTLEQVAAFRPSTDLLFGYVDAAHAASVERIERMTPEQLDGDFQYIEGRPARKVWQGLASGASDYYQHSGQIAYLRGLITGYGWRSY